MKICPNCNSQVDDNSSFCTYCGSKITETPTVAPTSTPYASQAPTMMPGAQVPVKPAKPGKPPKAPKPPKQPKAPKPPKQKKPGSGAKTAAIILGIATGLLAAALIGTIVYYEHECNLIIDKYQEQKSVLTTTKQELESANKTIAEKETEIDTLTAENKRLGDTVDEISGEALDVKQEADKLYKQLSQAKTTNGLVTTNSIVYAVKKGEKIKINLTWKAKEIYMGGDDDIISSKWVGNNVEVTGKKKGISYVDFSSDSMGLKDSFKVVVICYE